MAQKNKKRTSKKRSRARNPGPPPRRKRDGKEALRGMLYGAGIFAVLALVFFVRIGGETPFNHLVNAFSSDEKKKTTSTDKTKKKSRKSVKKTSKTVKKAIRTIKIPSGQKPVTTKPRAVTTNAAKAPPLEKTTSSDKNSLDKLIDSKSK
mgnify:CR=1 FL=1